LTPANQDPNQHPDDGLHSLNGKLSGRGCDDLHRDTGIGPDAHRGVDSAGRTPGPGRGPGPSPGPGWGPGPGLGFDPALVPGPDPGQNPDPGSRPGVRSYQAGPPDAARPGDPIVADDAGMGGLAEFGARRRGGHRLDPPQARLRGAGGERLKARPGWYAYRATGIAELPSWATEVALTIERPVEPDPHGPATLLLLRAMKDGWRACITEAVAEVENLAGVGPVAGVDTVAGARPGPGSRLLMGPAMAGLTPVTPAVAQADLAVAAARGLPAPLRRRRPAGGGMETSWRWSAGAVVTCEGPCGVSAQAAVALGGRGDVGAITPPPGGALVLRAWRAGRTWGVACGLLVGAASALGLGREAGRTAARARAEGWDAGPLTGPTAMQLARAGSPARPAPVDGARAASDAQVAALFEACLAAGGLGRPPAGSREGLSITP
jgi:hypothetical protein